MGVLGRARRGGAGSLRAADRRRSRRGGRHDLALGGRERARARASLRRGRDKIVISDFEFPTIGQICARAGVARRRVVHVRQADDATIPLERFERRDRRAHGARRGDARLLPERRAARRRGSRRGWRTSAARSCSLDAYQSAGSMPLDVRALGVDFLAAGTLKYLLGSAGLGFLYCRRDVVERVCARRRTGWFADQDIFEMDIHDYSPAPTRAGSSPARRRSRPSTPGSRASS